MDTLSVMKQALAALEIYGAPVPDVHDTLTALRTAIEQAEKQEPVSKLHGVRFDSVLHEHLSTPPTAQPVASEGWKLVPAVPTNEWVSNLAKMQSGGLEEVPFVEIHQCISELLDAAPNPPAAQRPVAKPHKWVGLTKEQRVMYADLYGSYEAVLAIEAKLCELNGGAV